MRKRKLLAAALAAVVLATQSPVELLAMEMPEWEGAPGEHDGPEMEIVETPPAETEGPPSGEESAPEEHNGPGMAVVGTPPAETEGPPTGEESAPKEETELEYEVTEDGYAVVTGYMGTETELTIPETLGGAPVRGVGDAAFAGMEVMSVILPPGLESIGELAFGSCTELQEVEFPESLEVLGRKSFYGCQSLTQARLGGQVREIGAEAFCKSGIVRLEIPAKVETIGENAFSECNGLSGITVNAENAGFIAEDGVLYGENGTRLVCCPAGKRGALVIRDGVQTADSRALYGCSMLTSVKFPRSMLSLPSSILANCRALTQVWLPEGLAGIGAFAFQGCASLTRLEVPRSVEEIGELAFEGCAEGFTLCGERGSEAERYARENGISFESTTEEAPADLRLVSGYPEAGARDVPRKGPVTLRFSEEVELVNPEAEIAVVEEESGEVAVTYRAREARADGKEVVLPDALEYLACGRTYYVRVGSDFAAYRPGDGPLVWFSGLEGRDGLSFTMEEEKRQIPEDAALILDREYLVLRENGESARLTASICGEKLPGSEVRWESLAPDEESTGEQVAVILDGVAEPRGAGSAVVVARVEADGKEYAARCRVDVIAQSALPASARLAESSVTVNPYSTGAQVKLLIAYEEQAARGASDGRALEGTASFAPGSGAEEWLEPVFVDGRTLRLVPRRDGEGNAVLPKKSSYRAGIELEAGGRKLELGTLTIRAEKRRPAVKAGAVKLNRFYQSDAASLSLTSAQGRVRLQRAGHTLPKWLELLPEGRIGLAGEPEGRSAKLTLLTEVDGYEGIPVPVQVKVTVVQSAPKVKLSQTTVTLYEAAQRSGGAALSLKGKTAGEAPGASGLRVVPVAELTERERGTYAANSRFEAAGYDAQTGAFRLLARAGEQPAAGRVLLEAEFEGSAQTVRLPVTVRVHAKKTAVRARPAKTSVALNPLVERDTAVIPLSYAPADFRPSALNWSVTERGKALPDDFLDLAWDGERLTVGRGRGEPGHSYRVELRPQGAAVSAPSVLTVRILAKDVKKSAPAVSISVKGRLDTLRPKAQAVVTAKVKNCNAPDLGENPFRITAVSGSGRNAVEREASGWFRMEAAGGGVYRLTLEEAAWESGEIDPGLRYKIGLREGLELGGCPVAAREVSLPLAQGRFKVTQDVKKLALFGDDRYDEGLVTLLANGEPLGEGAVVRIKQTKERAPDFEVRPLGKGRYAVGFYADQVQDGLRKSTVRLEVFLPGNSPYHDNARPNATLSLAVMVV